MKPSELVRTIEKLEGEMNRAAADLNFEDAARFRDLLILAKGYLD